MSLPLLSEGLDSGQVRWVSESLVKNEGDEKGLDAKLVPADRGTDSDAI